jgi:hypothetical protein
MITNGRFYTAITGDGPQGNDKYSSELKASIEEAGQLCIDNLNAESYYPIMLLGSIQSGKTRAFIGLMSLCFDNGFDMTIILTKCSKALVQQTVSRMAKEFENFRTGNATESDVVAQDILGIDFRGAKTREEKEGCVSKFLRRYKGKKRIIVVKKEGANVDRMNMFVEELIRQNSYKRILIVDDEADITSIGYEKSTTQRKDSQNDITLRRISGAVNTMRKNLHSNIEHVVMQVTATPYALYLQPECFANDSIMPIKPRRTVVLPTGKGYIGGQYYFMDAEDESSPNYDKAKHLLRIVLQEEMDILNGSGKNSGKNSLINDRRSVKPEHFINGQKKKSTYKLPSLRSWLFDLLVGAAIIQLNPGNEGIYLAAVMHAATAKATHSAEMYHIEGGLNDIELALGDDINNEDVAYFIEQAYNGYIKPVKAYGVLQMPTIEEVKYKIAHIEGNTLDGLLKEVDIKAINSDEDIMTKLDSKTGELKLESSITIFVGGQVLDRGITIPNMISFFYGRDPKSMQQDTVMQHCRMFGYRKEYLLSVTRFYTTYRIFSDMKEIMIRDTILRDRMIRNGSGEVVYLEAGAKIKACSPQKILASNINSIMPEKRYLPVGFDVDKKKAKRVYSEIDDILLENDAYLPEDKLHYGKDGVTDGMYRVIDSETALKLIRTAYSTLKPLDDGRCTRVEDIEPVFLFSLSENARNDNDEIALIVRKGRKLSKMKRHGTAYQDGPDDGNNEGALARELRLKMPVLVLTEQIHEDWGARFWWPVYYTPEDMNMGIYAEAQAKTGVEENIGSMSSVPIVVDRFKMFDDVGLDDNFVDCLNSKIDEIKDFYDSQFKMDGMISNTKKRKSVECVIDIQSSGTLYSELSAEEQLEYKFDKANKIVAKLNIPDDAKQIIADYFELLRNKQLNDEARESFRENLTLNDIDELRRKRLTNIAEEAENIILQSNELCGAFFPSSNGNCKIHIYYETILEVCKSRGYDEKSMLKFCGNVLAHELYHALHYADVLTESGRWIYKNKDYFKQGVVQEALAEYFTLCYAKKQDIEEPDKIGLVSIIRDTRNVEEFPNDGGYSGALKLEEKEVSGGYGRDNAEYARIYKDSMTDMPKAFYKL